ncbi:MAG: hypothetical protein RL621_2167 [Bacteroidota bacterium]|jgi:hypothetical protein
MAIGVTVNYTIEDLDFHDNRVQIKYLLDNDEAPLTKRYLEVYDLNTLYSGLGDTTVTSEREDLIESNFLSLTSATMTVFADEARRIILSGIGSSVGIGLTGVTTFSKFDVVNRSSEDLKLFNWLHTHCGI